MSATRSCDNCGGVMARRARLCGICRMAPRRRVLPRRAWVLLTLLALAALFSLR
jgi:hypothetical protein